MQEIILLGWIDKFQIKVRNVFYLKQYWLFIENMWAIRKERNKKRKKHAVSCLKCSEVYTMVNSLSGLTQGFHYNVFSSRTTVCHRQTKLLELNFTFKLSFSNNSQTFTEFLHFFMNDKIKKVLTSIKK